MKQISHTLSFEVYDSVEELSKEEQILVEASRQASMKSYAPYSEFQVGAAVLLDDGTVVTGSNQENIAYPSGLCAERVALFHAQSQYPERSIKSIVISAHSTSFNYKDPVTPCGACRQVMAEYEERHKTKMRVIMTSTDGKVLAVNELEALLPFGFKAEALKKRK